MRRTPRAGWARDDLSFVKIFAALTTNSARNNLFGRILCNALTCRNDVIDLYK